MSQLTTDESDVVPAVDEGDRGSRGVAARCEEVMSAMPALIADVEFLAEDLTPSRERAEAAEEARASLQRIAQVLRCLRLAALRKGSLAGCGAKPGSN
jgi:hypothetical protein